MSGLPEGSLEPTKAWRTPTAPVMAASVSHQTGTKDHPTANANTRPLWASEGSRTGRMDLTVSQEKKTAKTISRRWNKGQTFAGGDGLTGY